MAPPMFEKESRDESHLLLRKRRITAALSFSCIKISKEFSA
jgi:hypothetical protein